MTKHHRDGSVLTDSSISGEDIRQELQKTKRLAIRSWHRDNNILYMKVYVEQCNNIKILKNLISHDLIL